MAGITDVFKNTPIAIAVLTILYITAVFYAVGDFSPEQVVTVTPTPMTINTPNYTVPIYTESSVAFTVNPKDAIAYLVNVAGVHVNKPHLSTILTVQYPLTASNSVRTDYVNYYFYESARAYYQPNVELPLINLVTYYEYILQNTQITFSATRTNGYLVYTFTVTTRPPFDGDEWSYMVKNASEIAPSAYASIAIAKNILDQGYMIGFYKDYLSYMKSTANEYFLNVIIDTVRKTYTLETAQVYSNGNGQIVTSNTVYAYMFMFLPHSLVISEKITNTDATYTTDSATKTFLAEQEMVVTDPVINSEFSNLAATLAGKRQSIVYFAQAFYLFEHYYGAAPAQVIDVQSTSSYPAGKYVISGAELAKQFMYSYKDYFFNSKVYYSYNAPVNDLWKGYYYAPESIKSLYLYYLSLPPVTIPKTAYNMGENVFYAANDFGTMTSSTSKTTPLANNVTIVNVTSSVYATGVMTGDISIRIPMKYGELYKNVTVYLFGTHPTFTTSIVVPATFRTTSTEVVAVFRNVSISFTKPTSPTETITLYVAMVVSEAMPRPYVPPISGTYILIPQFATSTSFMNVIFTETVDGQTDTIYMAVPVLKIWATGFSSTPMSDDVTYSVRYSFLTVEGAQVSGKILTYITTPIIVTINSSTSTIATYTGYTTISTDVVGVPSITTYTGAPTSFVFNLNDYLSSFSSLFYANPSDAPKNTYITASPVFNGSISFATGTTTNSDPITVVRDEFYTAARVEIMITYPTSTTSTSSITSRTLINYSMIGSTTFTYSTIIYTTYFMTTYYTTLNNVEEFSASFIPDSSSNPIMGLDDAYYDVPSSFISNNYQTAIFYGEILETKIILRRLGLNLAEANNYINVVNIRAQWAINTDNSNVVLLTSISYIPFDADVVLANPTATQTLTMHFEEQVSVITPVTINYANNMAYSGPLGMILKKPADPLGLFMTILYGNYPLVNIPTATTYQTKTTVTTLGTLTITRTFYSASTNELASYVAVAVFETYAPGQKLPIVRKFASYITSYSSVSLALPSTAFALADVYIPIITPETFIYYNYVWYPPVDFLVSTMPYVMAIPDYSNVVYYLNVYSSVYLTSSSSKITFKVTDTLTKTIVTSIGASSTYYTTTVVRMTRTLATYVTSTSMFIASEYYEGLYPQEFIFVLDVGALWKGVTKTTTALGMTIETYERYFDFNNYAMAIPPVSFVTLNIVYTSGTFTGITRITSPVQLYPYPVNTLETSLGDELYRAWLQARGSGTATVVKNGETYTFIAQFDSKPPYFLFGSLSSYVNSQNLIPILYWPSLTAGFYASAKMMTVTTVVSGATETYYVFGFDTSMYTSFSVTSFNIQQFIYQLPLPFINIYRVEDYYPLFDAEEEYAPYVIYPESFIMNLQGLAPYVYYKYVTHYLYGIPLEPGAPNTTTVIKVYPGDPFPFTTVSGYYLEPLETNT